MPEDRLRGILARAAFGFVGKIEQLGATTMSDVPVDDHTAVVTIEWVLHSPAAFAGWAGTRVTLQLASEDDLPSVGERAAFFANGLAFGESALLEEVGRCSIEELRPHIDAAAEAGDARPLDALRRELEDSGLREHAAGADAVVAGRVLKLESALTPGPSEHDPDWWRATIDVHHVEAGDLEPGELVVAYPNSLDVRWHRVPKPKASAEGVWILHATERDMREIAPFQILHPEDYQPIQRLDALRSAQDTDR